MATTTPDTGIQDKGRGFHTWHRNEVFGQTPKGRYVPNVDDAVVDWTQGLFRVSDVDYTTGFCILVPWEVPKNPDEDDGLDILLGIGPGYSSESYRMFLDTSVTPHTLTPNRRLRFYGSMVSSYRVFLGSDISEASGEVVSTFYDASNNFLGTAVPLETGKDINGLDAPTIKIPMAAYTLHRMSDGEKVTIVAYDAEGGVVSTAQLLVVNTAAIRQPDTARKYIRSIQLDSPFISSSDPNKIDFPINVTVASLPMTGLVNYSDGSRVRLPIDGGKFSLFGIENYVATVNGQALPMVLNYRLAEDEISYLLEPAGNRTLNVSYRAVTTPVDGAYEVKLFIYPTWVSETRGYLLQYWLYNLNRETFYNVTQFIELGTNSAPFDPMRYGSTQTMTVALDLNKVDGKFAPYRHVQTFQVALLTAGSENRGNWEVRHTPEQAEPYGRSIKAAVEYVNTNFWRLDVTCGETSQEIWFQKLFDRVEPLYNQSAEVAPPRPTHFVVRFLGNTYEFSVAQWSEKLVVNNDLNEGEAMYIDWISRNHDTDLYLATVALPVHQIN